MFQTDRYTLTLATISGIEVRLHLSVVVIFCLVVLGLGNGILPAWHPDWSGIELWSTALATGVIFFVSLLAHELSHALVAKAHDLPVPRITLFLFGGIAEMEREAPTPRVELLVAAAGPAMSLALSVVFYMVFLLLAPAEFTALSVEDPLTGFATLSPTATAAFWLASVNLILAVFNLIPGFPLDGGRVFRAFLWWRSGDQLKATRRAAETGRFFGWALMAIGLLIFLRGDVVGGAWIALIGWFLSRLAAASVTQLVVDRALKGLRVQDLMRTRFETVDGDMAVDRFVKDYLLRSSQLVWPVRHQGQDVGVFNLKDISALEDPAQSSRKVCEIMRSVNEVTQLDPGLSGKEALKRLTENSDVPVPVVHRGRVVGLMHQGDILKWLSLHNLYPN